MQLMLYETLESEFKKIVDEKKKLSLQNGRLREQVKRNDPLVTKIKDLEIKIQQLQEELVQSHSTPTTSQVVPTPEFQAMEENIERLEAENDQLKDMQVKFEELKRENHLLVISSVTNLHAQMKTTVTKLDVQLKEQSAQIEAFGRKIKQQENEMNAFAFDSKCSKNLPTAKRLGIMLRRAGSNSNSCSSLSSQDMSSIQSGNMVSNGNIENLSFTVSRSDKPMMDLHPSTSVSSDKRNRRTVVSRHLARVVHLGNQNPSNGYGLGMAGKDFTSVTNKKHKSTSWPEDMRWMKS